MTGNGENDLLTVSRLMVLPVLIAGFGTAFLSHYAFATDTLVSELAGESVAAVVYAVILWWPLIGSDIARYTLGAYFVLHVSMVMWATHLSNVDLGKGVGLIWAPDVLIMVAISAKIANRCNRAD